MKKLLFVYNPNAGKGKINKHLQGILNIFESGGYDVSVYETKAPMDGKNEVERSGANYDLIVCFGGDGTLSEITSGVMNLEKNVPIGFIPAGSTNDTAGSYKIPSDIEEAARVAVSGKPFFTDVGSLGDRNFIYVASFGDISAVSAFTPQEAKKKFGHAAYLVEGIKRLPKMRYQHMKMEYDGNEIEGDFFLGMITNSFQVGGFKGITGKSVDLQDGVFEVLLLNKPRNILDFERIVNGVLIKKDDGNVTVNYGKIPDDEDGYKLVYKFKAKNLKIFTDEKVQWVVDGEDAGTHNDIEIINHNKAVQIMVKD